MVSNCRPDLSNRYRMDILNQVKNIMGADFTFLGVCGTDSRVKDLNNDDIRAEYKFFIAFENTICPNYITEKLLRPLTYNSVPIVAGLSREEYEKRLPGSAFIHIEDYPSIPEMIQDIMAISNNKERYDQFFDWRRDPGFARTEHVNRNAVFQNLLGVTMSRECSLVDWLTTDGNLEKEHHVDVIRDFSDPRPKFSKKYHQISF